LDKKNNENTRNSGEYDKRLTELIQANSKEIEKVNLLLSEISKLIDTINTTYVTKKEFNSLVGEVNKFKDLVAKELKDGSKSKKSSSSNMSSADIETKAKSLYDKKLYAEALEQYNDLIKKNYKPAQSHYMVGEIEYYRKNYSEAIAYFKKSATLYNKASYMPVLMLHTAISMDETGDKKNAKTFYEAVISSYPDSTSAKTAKNKLSLLK
jgi:TolA-binding protein